MAHKINIQRPSTALITRKGLYDYATEWNFLMAVGNFYLATVNLFIFFTLTTWHGGPATQEVAGYIPASGQM